MEEIKYPTGKFEIDWLLEKPNRALETNSLSEAIKYLIEKHNELVRAMADTTHENNGLHKHIVSNSAIDTKELRKEFMRGVHKRGV